MDIKMRGEQEMFDLILNTAKNDERIRAVYMNGSRTNPNAPKDIYRDYDIVYVVTKTASFLADKGWVSIFGEAAIIQEPDSKDFGFGEGADFTRSYGWLMLFKDANRIDLHIITTASFLEDYLSDTLTVPLLDKDGILPAIPASNDSRYHIKKPELPQYMGCCNEFWWCLNNVAKGIVRDELPYAMDMFNRYVRDMLVSMLEWHIGINTDFSLSSGKMGKYFKKYLSKDLYEMYSATYSDSNYDNMWKSIFTACELFRITAAAVGEKLGYKYNYDDDKNTIDYLINIKH